MVMLVGVQRRPLLVEVHSALQLPQRGTLRTAIHRVRHLDEATASLLLESCAFVGRRATHTVDGDADDCEEDKDHGNDDGDEHSLGHSCINLPCRRVGGRAEVGDACSGTLRSGHGFDSVLDRGPADSECNVVAVDGLNDDIIRVHTEHRSEVLAEGSGGLHL